MNSIILNTMDGYRILCIGVPLLLVAIFAVLVVIAVDLDDIKHGKGGK